MTRTHDLLITNQLHYRLCYTSNIDFFKTTYLLYPKKLILSSSFFKKEKKTLNFFKIPWFCLILMFKYDKIKVTYASKTERTLETI